MLPPRGSAPGTPGSTFGAIPTSLSIETILPSRGLFNVSSCYWQVYRCWAVFYLFAPPDLPTFVDRECFNHKNANKSWSPESNDFI